MWWLALQAPAISRSLLLSEHKMWVTTSRLPTGTGAMEARMSDNLASVWTEDRLTDLTRLWTEGLSMILLTVPVFYPVRSEEHTSELQSLMRISYAVFCLKKKTNI